MYKRQSFDNSRAADIKGIEDAIQAAYPDWSVRRAFTAQIIINHVQARDGEKIDNMEQALERAVANGVKNLVGQPLSLIHILMMFISITSHIINRGVSRQKGSR